MILESIHALLYNSALAIGTVVLLWYGSKFVVCLVRATVLAFSFYCWSTAGIKSERRKQEWWRKLYIVVFWFQFLGWERGCQSITTSYGTFRWWNDKTTKAKEFTQDEEE